MFLMETNIFELTQSLRQIQTLVDHLAHAARPSCAVNSQASRPAGDSRQAFRLPALDTASWGRLPEAVTSRARKIVSTSIATRAPIDLVKVRMGRINVPTQRRYRLLIHRAMIRFQLQGRHSRKYMTRSVCVHTNPRKIRSPKRG